MMYRINRFFRQLKRVYDFLPIIWRGVDFDYHYSIELFKYQLTRLANYLESDEALSYSAKSDARRLRTIIDLIDRAYVDYYYEEHIKYMKDTYGDCTLEEKDGEINWRWEKATDDLHNRHINEIDNTLFMSSISKEQRAKDLLWKMVAHNIEKFWD